MTVDGDGDGKGDVCTDAVSAGGRDAVRDYTDAVRFLGENGGAAVWADGLESLLNNHCRDEAQVIELENRLRAQGLVFDTLRDVVISLRARQRRPGQHRRAGKRK